MFQGLDDMAPVGRVILESRPAVDQAARNFRQTPARYQGYESDRLLVPFNVRNMLWAPN